MLNSIYEIYLCSNETWWSWCSSTMAVWNATILHLTLGGWMNYYFRFLCSDITMQISKLSSATWPFNVSVFGSASAWGKKCLCLVLWSLCLPCYIWGVAQFKNNKKNWIKIFFSLLSVKYWNMACCGTKLITNFLQERYNKTNLSRFRRTHNHQVSIFVGFIVKKF